MKGKLDLFSIDSESILGFGTWCWDLQTQEFDCSKVMLSFFGEKIEPINSFTNFLSKVYVADRDRVYGEIHEAAILKKHFNVEFRINNLGNSHYFLLKGQYSTIENDKEFYIGTFSNISDKKNLIINANNSHNNLKRTQRIANIGSWTWNFQNKEIICDDSMYEIFGVDPQISYLSLKSLRAHFSPMEWKKCLMYIKKQLYHRKEGWFEQKIFSGDGKQKDVSVFFELEFTETGKIKAINGVVQDVSKQKSVQDQLRSRIEFERMIGAISSNFINLKSTRIDAGIRLALEIICNFINVNRSYLFLFSSDQNIANFEYQWSSEINRMLGPELMQLEIDKFPLLMGTLIKGETLYIEDCKKIKKLNNFERDFINKIGVNSLVWVPISLEGQIIGGLGFDSISELRPWTNEEISLVRICGEIFVNALSRKKNDQEIKKSEEYLMIVLDSIGDSVIALDENKKISNVNLSAEILTGYSRPELMGKNISDVLIFKKNNEMFHTYEDLACKEVEGYASNFWEVITKDNIAVPVSIHSAPLKGHVLQLRGTVVVCREMTNQLKLEEQLRHSEKMRVIGQLSGGIAHDFNNLLTGIIGCANYLKKNLKSHPNLIEYIENILTTGRRAANLTSQLLAFSRYEKPKFAEIDLNQIIADVVNLLMHTIDPKIQILKNLNSQYSVLEGDESQLHNALLNLAVNARDAMPNGGALEFITNFKVFAIKDCVQEYASLKPGNYIEVIVKDSGCGIPNEVISHIFEPFFTTKEKGKGTGLGLAAVYGTIFAHHGCIVVKSEVNQYSEFHLFLPLLNKNFIEKVINQEVGNNNDIINKKILVVDDEILLCSLVCESLSDAGYKVKGANSGLDALKIFDEENGDFDLILVDMLMPVMNGIELLDRIFKIKPQIKAIILSGFTGNLDLKNYLNDKKIPFLQKPYEENQLIKIVEHSLTS